MKHIFVINPVAGFENSYKKITAALENYIDKYDIIIHVTTNEKDACAFSKEFATKNANEEVRFYSCGGDGTLGEVVNGIVGLENASVTCFPCGSGNDFVKSVGGKDRFLDLEKLFHAKNKKIDLIKVNDYYSLNATNVGFDARVCKYANLSKGKSKNPYTLGIIKALFTGLTAPITVEIDGKVVNPKGKVLLSTFANGGYMGGKYFAAPRYVIDDGLIEFCFIHPTNLLNFARLIKKYEKGLHLEDKSFKKLIDYRRIEKAKIYADKEFDLCVDGEMFIGKEFNIEIVKGALNFALPD